MQKLLFSIEGRIGRWTYWKWSLILNALLLSVTVLLILAVQPIIQSESDLIEVGLVDKFFILSSSLLCSISYIAGTWGLVALAVKRLHDMNKSGFELFWVIAFGIFYLIYLGLNKGVERTNDYGENPLEI